MNDGRYILVAEDNDAEIELYKRAFRKLGLSNYTLTHDGIETIAYLQGHGKFADRDTYPFPDWLLTDLKMPRKDGLEVLQWMQENPTCRVVPTIMLSNSNQIKDITRAYEFGVNAFFTKPTRLQELIDTLALINHFWSIAQRPPIGAFAHLRLKRVLSFLQIRRNSTD